MNTTTKEKIKFSKAFWVANTVELFERAAYYGVFIVITLYLSRILGFNDIQAAGIGSMYGFRQYAGRQFDYPEYAPGRLHDGGRHCIPGSGRDFYLSAFPRIFLFAGPERRRRALSGIQPSALFPFFHLRIRAIRIPAKQILP